MKKKVNVTISTAHKYKGLEKTVVIILDAVELAIPLSIQIGFLWKFLEIQCKKLFQMSVVFFM